MEPISLNHHESQTGSYQRDFPNTANISESSSMPDWSLSKRFSKPKPYKQFTVLDILRKQLCMPAVSSHAPKVDTPSPAISTFSHQAPTTLKQSSVSVMSHLCVESLPPTFKSKIDARDELERGLCSEVLLCPERAPLSAACQVSGQSKTIRFSHSGFKHPKRYFF